jgi:hypothetical protein
MISRCARRIQDGFTVLMRATETNVPDCVRLLSEHGADMEARDNVRAPRHVIIVIFLR